MDFSLNDDHIALRQAVQRFCDAEYPVPQRGDAETGEQAVARWSGMAELGLLGMSFAPEFGGSALGPIEVMLVAQEFGRALAGGAFVASTVLAGTLLTRLGLPAQQTQWLPALAEGRLRVAVAYDEQGARYDWTRTQMQARAEGASFALNGRKLNVMHADTADLLLVLARTAVSAGDATRAGHAAPAGAAAGLTLFAVDARAPGVTVQGFDTLDGRRAAHVSFTNTKVDAGRLLGERGEAAAAMEAALDAATAALCAEAAGAAEAVLSLTCEHLRTRQQFGSPLARFQVLQHRVADMAIALEQLKSMACIAAMAVQAGEPSQRRRLVSAAKVLASQQGRQLGLDAIQMHGAMGMTQECRIGHYAKRLMVIGQSLGDAAWHLQRVSAAT